MASIVVYDSLTREKRPLVPRVPGEVSIYVCGVTPYAQAHVGHARPAVIWDVIRRHLVRRGYRVRFVQNYTDIDDKLVLRARESGEKVEDLAARYIRQYEELMGRLGVMPPDFAPRVTGHLQEILNFIQGLVDRGAAYQAGGDIYFAVSRDAAYGQLSGQRLDEVRQGVRIDVAEGKRDPLDFALWKSCPEDEPGWPSPWGRGRPGWHIECSAMSARYLGPVFDLHGGGIDLVFPHHENERAQSRAFFGQESAQCWVHNGLITQGAVKMSKSLGNGVLLEDLLKTIEPRILRSYLLSVHYRTPLDFSVEGLQDWGRGLQRVWRVWDSIRDAPAPASLVDADWVDSLVTFEGRLLSALDDDFNTARAFGLVFEMIRDMHRGVAAGYSGIAQGLARANLVKADSLLGFLPAGDGPSRDGDDELVKALVGWREQVRSAKDWALADRIREVIMQAGYVLEDTPAGVSVRRGQAAKGE